MIIRIALATVLSAAVATAALAATTPPAPRAPAKTHWSCSLPDPTPQPSSQTPSQALLDALPVLQRPRTADDAITPAGLRSIGPFSGPVMLDAARRVRPHAWIVPVVSVHASPWIPARCVRSMTAEQRRDYERAQRVEAAKPPVEGVQVLTDDGGGLGGEWSTDDVNMGRSFRITNCAGAKHDQLQVSGLVPGAVDSVRVTARDGTITDAAVDQNLVIAMFARPASAAALPAHVTVGAGTFDLQGLTAGLLRPCERPAAVGQGMRLATPEKLEQPAGAVIELATRRWEAEDTVPLLAGATYRHAGGRCLMVASRAQLERKPPRQRFCVSDAQLKAKGVVARVRRAASGALVLEGFADRSKYVWITVEKAPGGNARVVWPAKRSGAFFLAVRKGVAGRSFSFHAAKRGLPVRYTALKTLSG